MPQFFVDTGRMERSELWPALLLDEWRPTYRTLHMWTQIVGKIRMTLTPPLNHWWHVTLYVNPSGLTTGPIPCPAGVFEILFDFQRHELTIVTSEGIRLSRSLCPQSVAAFYRNIMDALGTLGIAVEIQPKPQEVADAVPFDQDEADCFYDADAAHRFWRILVSSSKVLERFRSKFLGKCSPTQFFWGSFDLACTRFSGRLAPPRKGVISGPAYSHEESSAGFWPGGGAVDGPAYYAYTIPRPDGLETAAIRPAAAKWNAELSEFILMYDDVRAADSPEETLYEFLASTYEAGATLGKWDRATLEV
jgi:hypothetical protein